MPELLLIFIAPVAYIILCCFNIGRKSAWLILLITFAMIGVGIALSITAGNIMANRFEEKLPDDRIRCGTAEGAIMLLGMLLAVTVIPFTGFVSFICFLLRKKTVSAT